MPKSTKSQTPAILGETELRFLAALQEYGTIEDQNGFATRVASTLVPQEDNGHPSQRLKALEEYGLLTREMRGKRTYRIELTEQGQRSAGQSAQLIGSLMSDLSMATPENLVDALLSHITDAKNHVDHSACVDHSECNERITELTEENSNLTLLATSQTNLLIQVKQALAQVNDGSITWLEGFNTLTNAMEQLELSDEVEA